MNGEVGLSTYAGFWRRLVAIFIDGIILYIIDFVLLFLFSVIGVISATSSNGHPLGQLLSIIVGPVAIITMIVVSWLYFAGMEASSKQATLGKMAMGIIVTDLYGNPISFGRATGRYFGKIISGLILAIGYIMAGFTEKKQALHDIIASCVVAQRKLYQIAGSALLDVERSVAEGTEVSREPVESSGTYDKEMTSMRREEPIVIRSEDRGRASRAPEDGPRTEAIKKRPSSSPMAWLVEQDDSGPGRDHRISKETTTIGSTSGSDIVLRDRTVSRRHAEIGISGGKFYVYDMNSTNGTFVNGQPCKGQSYLRDGDEIQMGNVLLIFKTVGRRKDNG